MRKQRVRVALITIILALSLVLQAFEGITAGAEENVYSVGGETVDCRNRYELELEDITLQFGGLGTSEGVKSGEQDLCGITEEPGEGIARRLYSALDDFETTVDVSEYEMDVDGLTCEVANFLNKHPEFFYVEGVEAVCDRDNRFVEELVIDYDAAAAEKEAAYEAQLQSILLNVNRKWSDEEKALYLHDYLVTHCQYDTTLKGHSAYDALVNHSAVCEGYALAFGTLCAMSGIPAYIITSIDLSHAWNMIEINGKMYYVDCTWDDPRCSDGSYFLDSKCRHNNLLCSQSQMILNGHNTTDWMGGDVLYYGKYNNTEFDSAPWKSSRFSSVACLDDCVLYINSDDGSLYKYTCGGSSSKLLTVGNGAYWPVHNKQNSYYSVFYGILVTINGYVFLNSWDKIYNVNVSSGSLSQIYELSSNEKNSGQIFGMTTEASGIKYDLATLYTKKEYVASGYLDVSGVTGQVVKSVTIDRSFYSFSKEGDTVKLNVNVIPSGISSVKWLSSDSDVATVDSDGLVTAVGSGYSYIYAWAEKTVAVCKVELCSTWQEDYEYYLYENQIRLTRYKGTDKYVPVPAKAYIDGKSYTTAIYGSVWTFDTNIKAVVIGDGTIIKYGYNTFFGCTNLEGVYFGQCECVGLTNTNSMFSNCRKLYELNLHCFDMSQVSDAGFMLNNCTNLTSIVTPKSINREISIPLPAEMYVVNSDGTFGTIAYTDLAEAPVKTKIAIDPSKMHNDSSSSSDSSIRKNSSSSSLDDSSSIRKNTMSSSYSFSSSVRKNSSSSSYMDSSSERKNLTSSSHIISSSMRKGSTSSKRTSSSRKYSSSTSYDEEMQDDGNYITRTVRSGGKIYTVKYSATVSYNGLKHIEKGGRSSRSKCTDVYVKLYDSDGMPVSSYNYKIAFRNNKNVSAIAGFYIKPMKYAPFSREGFANAFFGFTIERRDLSGLSLSVPEISYKNGNLVVKNLYYYSDTGKKILLKQENGRGKGDFYPESDGRGGLIIHGKGNYTGKLIYRATGL